MKCVICFYNDVDRLLIYFIFIDLLKKKNTLNKIKNTKLLNQITNILSA